MARPKSEDKRIAILRAATQVFAERGLGAPTSAISVAAGVAEGTLFTYFKSKDELVNALYREIKMELAEAMMSGFPRKKSMRHRLQHVWDCYVKWGVANPMHRRVLAQLEVSDRLTEGAKMAGSAPFAEIQTMAEEAIEQRIVRELPLEFVAATMRALAEMTMDFMAAKGKSAAMYQVKGFEILWAAIARKS